MSRTTNNSARKAKKSYTLSPESIAFLEALRKKRRSSSTSAVLDEILQAVRRELERDSVDRAVTDYYSSLSRTEAAERAQWGEFSLQEFSLRENS